MCFWYCLVSLCWTSLLVHSFTLSSSSLPFDLFSIACIAEYCTCTSLLFHPFLPFFHPPSHPPSFLLPSLPLPPLSLLPSLPPSFSPSFLLSFLSPSFLSPSFLPPSPFLLSSSALSPTKDLSLHEERRSWLTTFYQQHHSTDGGEELGGMPSLAEAVVCAAGGRWKEAKDAVEKGSAEFHVEI